MRRYRIVVTSPSGTSASSVGASTTVSAGKSLIWDSQVNGQDNTAALDMQFDISVGPMGLAVVGSYVEVFGLSISDVAKVRRYQGGTMSIYGGFSAGFPLANPNQYGLLAKGYVLQAFGNWTGDHQSASFILAPAGIDKQMIFHWQVGQKLSDAINQAVTTSYTGFTVTNNLTVDPVATVEDAHICDSLYALSEYVNTVSVSLGLATVVGGIRMSMEGTQVVLYDKARTTTAKQIDFNDFQGQPVNFGYGASSTVQTAVNLRSDLSLGGTFKFPTQVSAGYILNQPAAPAPLPKDNSILTGTFLINQLRHVGRFRDPSAQAWTTIANGVQM